MTTCRGPKGGRSAAENRETGMALLVVLWTLLLLSVIAASLSSQARKQGYLARNASMLARSEAAAEGGIVRGVAALLDPRVEMRWAADGSPHRFVLDGVSIEVRIIDEAGKVDLNTGAPELLAALLQTVGAGPDVAFTIASEVAAFRNGTATGQPRGFETTSELLGVPGMTPALFERVAPFVTVLTHARGIDPNVAPPAILAAFSGRGASAPASGSEGGGIAGAAGFVTESQHVLYSIESVAIAGPARYAHEAIVRLTHSSEIPFLVHSWHRATEAAPTLR